MTAIGSLLAWLTIVSVAGFLACLIVTRSYGFGILGNTFIGILGWALAEAILPRLGVQTGGALIGDVAGATAGAIVSLFLIGVFVGASLFLIGALWKVGASLRP
jgi:uncharacterized membrane protein YeaQ/YmgE (transglycosylase-associated protein family)